VVEPGFSVVVPSFNRVAMLPETLDAILAQRPAPREVILVDDGSTDGTQAMLAARYAGRVRGVVTANAGDLAARNTGLRLAREELVAFCDSDDVWEPGFLAAMATLWRAEPATRVAFSDFCILRQGGREAACKFAAAPADFWQGLRAVASGMGVFDAPIVERVIRFQPFFPSCMVARRGFLLGLGGWDESVGRVVGTDFATLLLLAEHAPFGVIRKPLVAIRKHADNFSADVQAMNLGDAAILEHVLARRPSLAPLAPFITASVSRRRAEALDTAFARHDFASVGAIFATLPAGWRGARARLKAVVSALPGPLRAPLAGLLLAWGSAAARHDVVDRVAPEIPGRGEGRAGA
jgi:glycosyltransferase involved in cell wall biosynthesis